MRIRQLLLTLVLLIVGHSLRAQSIQDDLARNQPSYKILDIHDYSYDALVDEGIFTLDHQLEVMHVPFRQLHSFIKRYIGTHHYALNKGKRRVRKTTFRAIAFAYPSVSPTGEPLMLSGLVTIPVLDGNKPTRMLIYHRILAASNRIAPTNSMPIEAVLTADNTVCVFPDYYGCGITSENPVPFISLNYHARCATECALAALDVVRDQGVALDDGFYTWTTGYSQGGGFALATHRFVENTLPDSLARRINLRWSFCGGGIFTPIDLFKSAIVSKDMGSMPAVYLQGLRSLFSGHPECMEGLTVGDFLAPSAIALGLDSLMNTYDDGLWDLSHRVTNLFESQDPADYFNASARDTSAYLFHRLSIGFGLDDCLYGWQPRAPVALYHSEKDGCIPYPFAIEAQKQLSGPFGNQCVLSNPSIQATHTVTALFYFSRILHLDEDVLYHRYLKLD